MSVTDRQSWSELHDVPAEFVPLFEFVNTLDERSFGACQPSDALADPAALGRWCAAMGLAPAQLRPTVDDLQLAVELRAALRAAAQANRGGECAAPVGAVAERLPLLVQFEPDGGLELRPAGTGVPGVLAGLLATAASAAADGSWRRIKMCAAPDCRAVFYDHSKPRNGRWCATEGCGNRMKTRSYRERRRVSGAAG